MLGGYFPHSQSTSTPFMKRTGQATASHCYLIHGDYCLTLARQLEQCSATDVQFDLGWWPLQRRDRWFVADPVLAATRESQSDMTFQNAQMMARSTWESKLVPGSVHCYNSPAHSLMS